MALRLGWGPWDPWGSPAQCSALETVLSASASVSTEAHRRSPGPRSGVLGLGKAWSSQPHSLGLVVTPSCVIGDFRLVAKQRY